MFSLEFFITALVVVLIPGTGVVYTVSNGLFRGKQGGVSAALGCTLGILPHLLACILGLSAIMHMSALLFQTIKFVGVLYLAYLAWGMWTDKANLSFEYDGEDNSAHYEIIRKAMLINLLNPKLTIFFLTFLPQFISLDSRFSTNSQLLILSAQFMGLTLFVFVLYALAANSVKHFILKSRNSIRSVQKIFAMIFAGLSLKLALSD